MTDLRPSLADLGTQVQWPDSQLGGPPDEPVAPATGRLAELGSWLAATQGTTPPRRAARARLVVVGPVDDRVRAVAGDLDVGVRELAVLDAGSAPATATAAADAEVDGGADLIVLAVPSTPDVTAAAEVVIALCTRTEPVALLPRGPAAVDTAAWIARAERLRDTRRRVAGLRADADRFLAALGRAELAAACAFLLRAAGRRTALVLDGTAAVAAAVLAQQAHPATAAWCQVADAAPDAAHARGVEHLERRPLLDLATARGNGTAGLLCVPLLRAAADLIREPHGD